MPRIPEPADGPLIIATGPLTSDSLSADIAALVGGSHLYFYDAISPIVLAETHRSLEGVSRVALGPEPARARGRTRPAASTTGKGTI